MPDIPFPLLVVIAVALLAILIAACSLRGKTGGPRPQDDGGSD